MKAPLRLSRLPHLNAFTHHSAVRLFPRRNYSASAAPDPRWLSQLQARLQRLQSLKLAPEKAAEVQKISQHVQTNWLELLAGREGYLTGREWRGLDRHAVVWGDMDSMVRHVNNVVYNRYAESGRVNFLQSFIATCKPEHRQQWIDLMTPRSIGLILRSIKTDYKFPMTYPDRTTVLHKLIAKPDYDSDHVLLEAVILSEQFRRPAARCFEDIVVFDYQAAKKAPLKPFMVDELRKTFDLQEESRQEAESKVQSLIEAVDKIETETA